MKSLAMFLAVAIGAVAGIAATEDVDASRVTIAGDVVRYEAGKTIVIRSADGKEVTYAIAPALAAPPEVAIGRRVTLVTEPSDSGAVVVTRITTETGPNGTTTTTEKSVVPDAETKTSIMSVYGTVSAYEAGRTVTLLLPNATTATYTIDSSSSIPADLAKGRKVVIRTVTRPGSNQPIVRKVTYSKTTKKTKTKVG